MNEQKSAYNPELQAMATYVEDGNGMLFWRRVWCEGVERYSRDGLSWVRMSYTAHDRRIFKATLLADSCNADILGNLGKLATMYEVGNHRLMFKDLDDTDTSIIAGILDEEKIPIYLSPGMNLKRLQDIIEKTGESRFLYGL